MSFWTEHASCLSARGGARGRAIIACQQGSQAGALPSPYTHAGTPTHASHAEDIGTVLFQGLGFMICEYFILPRHSARQRHHDAFGAGIPPSLMVTE